MLVVRGKSTGVASKGLPGVRLWLILGDAPGSQQGEMFCITYKLAW